MQTKVEKCVSCGWQGERKKSIEELTETVGGHAFTGTVPAEVCPTCGEVYTTASVHQAFALSIARKLVDAGEKSGETLRFFRHILGLTAVQLAELLCVAPDTLYRWERAEREVDVAAWALVASLVLESSDATPRTRHLLERMQKPQPLNKAVVLESVR